MPLIVEPKSPPVGDGRQAEAYAAALGLEAFAREVAPGVERVGYMGVTIAGGMIWPTWSQSREVFPIGGEL